MEPVSAGILAGAAVLSSLFGGWAQGKITEQQLQLAAKQLGLSREQFEFMKQQALRQNRIADANTQYMRPLMDALMGLGGGHVPRVAGRMASGPPRTGNPYQRAPMGSAVAGMFMPPAPPPPSPPQQPASTGTSTGPGAPPALPTSPGELARMVALMRAQRK